MSFASYLYHGASGPNQEFCRDHYSKDEVKSIATTNQYAGKLGRAKKVDETREEVVIDSAVKVTTVAQKIREEAVNFWSKAKTGSYITFTVTLITGILAGGAAIAIGTTLPELWITAAAVGGVALAVLGLSIFLLTRAIKAGNRLEEWSEDGVANAKNTRIRIGKEGFYPAFDEKLKGKIVSGEELEKLWFRDMDGYVAKFDGNKPVFDATKVKLVREFIKKSPLANGALSYTFTCVEDPIQAVSTKFESVKSSADAIKRQSQTLKSQITSKKNKAMLENDQRRDRLLLPYRTIIKPRQGLLEGQISSLRIQIANQRSRMMQMNAGAARGAIPPTRTVVGARSNVVPGQRGSVVPGQRGNVVPGRRVVQHPVNPVMVNQIRSDIQLKEAELRKLESELAQVNTIYVAMTQPIKNMHARNEAKIKRWASGEIAKIETDEDKLFKKFYAPIQDILREYASRNSAVPAVAEAVKEPDVALNMETPEIDTTYEPVEYKDSWKSLISEFEWKKKQAELKEDQIVPSTMNG